MGSIGGFLEMISRGSSTNVPHALVHMYQFTVVFVADMYELGACKSSSLDLDLCSNIRKQGGKQKAKSRRTRVCL